MMNLVLLLLKKMYENISIQLNGALHTSQAVNSKETWKLNFHNPIKISLTDTLDGSSSVNLIHGADRNCSWRIFLLCLPYCEQTHTRKRQKIYPFIKMFTLSTTDINRPTEHRSDDQSLNSLRFWPKRNQIQYLFFPSIFYPDGAGIWGIRSSQRWFHQGNIV